MAGRTDELHSFFARARAAGISIASDGSSRNAASTVQQSLFGLTMV
jgi:hypothetical protein